MLTYKYLQALVLKKYSAVLILMLAYCSIIAVFSLLASLILEQDLSAFSLKSKTRLLSVLYSVCWRSLSTSSPSPLLKYNY